MSERKIKILLIEDDSFLINMYSAKFEIEGYSIFVAEDGVEGLEKTQKLNPDIILLDIVMPRMNGFEVLEKLKADGVTKNIPVVILSNINQMEDISKGLSLGAEDYFIKAHFVPSEIVKKVENILNKKSKNK